MIRRRSAIAIVFVLILLSIAGPAATLRADDPFRRENLVAWCIVPFDSQKRTPVQRAEMLEKLGIKALAYDYRAEHIASFDEELDQLAKHNIQLTAWWFPTQLNDEARLILQTLNKHNVKTQLWVTGSGSPTKTPQEQEARVAAEADRIKPIAQAAALQGCSVGLYNHGGWFGEPENQIAIIERLRRDGVSNVGIVYNQHHGHAHIDRFKELLDKMRPYLMAINLNGMVPDGDQKGQKIIPLGAGSLDLELLKIIRQSGYAGPVGILNHTDEDAEKRLLDNLDGLQWLTGQLDGKPAGPAPKYRSWKGAMLPALDGGKIVSAKDEYQHFPISVMCTAQLSTAEPYNILVAHHTKASGKHWELFTQAGNGRLSVYVPGYEPSLISGGENVCDGRFHQFVCLLEEGRVRLLVDGRSIVDEAVQRNERASVPGAMAIGRLVEGGLNCYGRIASVTILRGPIDPARTNVVPKSLANEIIGQWEFESPSPTTATPSSTASSSATSDGNTASSAGPMNVEKVRQLAAAAASHGVAERGVAVFASARTACLTCHKVGAFGGSVGPDLSSIGSQRTPEQLSEALLWPNQQVEEKYRVYQALTADSQVVTGYKSAESDSELVLRDPSTGNETRLAKDDLEAVRPMPSVMPDGLAAGMTVEQQQDLLAFLMDLGHHRKLRAEIAQSVLEHVQPHEPATFPFDRAPLDRQARYDWQAYVNRDRLYDFYTKEANYFRTHPEFEPLLAEYPGIDGGQQGHWGNQNETTWESDAWNLSQLGNVQAGVFRADKLVVARAVCVRLGDEGEMSVCFDPDTLSYRAAWQGGFVKFSKVRHGFINGLEADGTALALPDMAGPVSDEVNASQRRARYLGYYRVGPRVVFAYRLGDVEYLDMPWAENGRFVREVAPREEHSYATYIDQPPATSPTSPLDQPITTRITLGSGGAYVIDTIELPWDNPARGLIYCGDHDFLPDGSALVCTMQGDVWHVSGFSSADGQLPTHATWRRIASGLHHALGLRVSQDGIFVLGRDQLTRLRDTNGDGRADWYECYSNAFETSPAGHDYICGLQRDAEGNFYIASGNQGLVRISRDGTKAQTIAGGFRNPDGLGIAPDGTLTVPCSEGEWTPASMICAVAKSKWETLLDEPVDLTRLPFYGYRGSQYVKLPLARPELPLVYLPRGLDNSAGAQVSVDSQRWGPLAGQMIHLSFGTGSHFLLLRDEVRGQLQGAVVPLPGQFLSGVHRGRFSPLDGQLYVSGMAGWGSYTTERGCFQRVRYTGQQVQLPIGSHAYENGIKISFSQTLDRAYCEQAREHFAQMWNYRYGSAYGSSEYSALHYGMRGHDQLRIASVHVLPDNRSLFIELPDLQLCNQLHLQVATAPHERHDVFATLNALDEPLSTIPGINSQRKTLATHPLDIDMAMAARRLPNPWRKAIKGARSVRIEAGKNLSFSTRQLRARRGEVLALTLVNPDVVPHNWALIQPGTLSSVGAQANRLVGDPEGAIRNYVPQTSDVICFTDIVEPQEQATIYFKAPEAPGRYPFLCSFPGHWMVMNGEMIVE